MRELEGFDDFVAARSRPLMRLGYLLTGDHQHAEDLLQSTLLKTAQRWRGISDPAAYARRVMIHEASSRWRRRRLHEQGLDTVAERADGVDTAEAVARRAVFVAALRRLTQRQRAVLALRYYEDLSEADTARVLGCAVGTVKSQTHHALARLRELAPELADVAHTLTASEAM